MSFCVLFLQNIDLSQSMPNSPLPSTMPETCKATFLFLVLHGGKQKAKYMLYVVTFMSLCLNNSSFNSDQHITY